MKRKIVGVLCGFVLGYGVEEIDLEAVNINVMQYRLDELNRNLYYVDSEIIKNKGYSSVEQVFTYLPFVTFSHVGLGANIDLRGQGASANVNTQILLNGIGLNLLDSSHGVTPLYSIGVDEIESIEILPGGGAVMYGSGTRGGVVNILTKRRYESLSASAGIGYGYSNGSQAKINAKIGGKLDEGIYWYADGGYLFKEGYRDLDKQHLFNVSGGLIWDINPTHSVGADIGYFKGVDETTPFLRFGSIAHPHKSDRQKAGDGWIKSLQDRVYMSLNYDLKMDEANVLNFKLFYHYFKPLYTKNSQILDYTYSMRGLDFFLPHTQIFQDGSYFVDQKIGFGARYDFMHPQGLLIVGVDSLYAIGERKLDFDIRWNGNSCVGGGLFCVNGYQHFMKTWVDVNKWSNSFYVIEKYDFTTWFSLTGGARYELATYGGHREFYNQMNITLPIPPSSGGGRAPAGNRLQIPSYHLYKDISDLQHNFALEFIPKFTFALGDAYMKYERGFRSPNPDNLTSRNGNGSNHLYEDTHVKSETYDSFELGTKLFAGEHAMLMLTGFYTLTYDEIYILGSAHSGNGFKVGNYDQTQRAGVELASEQNFLEGMLGLSQSVSYVDARILNSGVEGIKNNSLIPYVSNYKATLGLSYGFYKGWNLWVNSSFVGAQRDTANHKIPAYNLTDLGVDFSYKHFSLSFGVRNIADTFYYSYYNQDKSDEITGYAFLIGEGRSYFLEGRYRF